MIFVYRSLDKLIYLHPFHFMTLELHSGTGNVVLPRRGTETFISTIGHLDTRVDLLLHNVREREGGLSLSLRPEMGNRALMDLCMMASKLAYENAQVIKNLVNHHWKASCPPLTLLNLIR